MNRAQSTKIFKAITLVGVYGGLLMPLVFIPLVIFPFVFSKLVCFQALVGLTFPAYLALAWMDKKYRPGKHILYFGILAYFVALALSVIFAVDPYRAWWGNQERMNGLFTLLHFLAWLTMAIGVLKKWEQWRKILNYEVVLSAIMALVAIVQRFDPNLLLFPAGPRVGGLLDNPIYMAAYQIFNLFFLALLAWKVRDRRWWWAYGIIGLLDIIAFVLAQSRGALLGLGVGIIVFVAYVGAFHKKKKVKLSLLGSLLALIAVYGLLFSFRANPFVANSPVGRFVNIGTSFSTRLIAWDIAWEGFLDRPITGWGLDNFHIIFNQKYHPESLRYGEYETWFDRAHNTIMDVLSMTGILGFITFVFIFVAILYSTIRAYKRGWIDLPIAAILFSLPIAYFVQNLFVFDHPAGFSMSYLLYALIIAATRGEFIGEKTEEVHAEEGKSGSSGTHSAPWIAFGVIQVAALVLVWRTSILPFRVSQLTIQANNTISFNFGRGLDLVEAASKIWTPYADEQSFLLSRNLVGMISNPDFTKNARWREAYDFAKELNERVLARHPKSTHTTFIYARLMHAFSNSLVPEDKAKAEAEYKKAIELSPKRQQLHYGLAQLYLENGRLDEAVAIMKRVRDFDPELGEGYWRYGIATLYDKHNLEEGAQQIALSQSVPFPYHIEQGREMLPLFDAYLLLENTDAVNDMIAHFDTLPMADEDTYAQIALKFVILKMPKQQAAVTAFAKILYPSTFDQTLQKYIEENQKAQSSSTTE